MSLKDTATGSDLAAILSAVETGEAQAVFEFEHALEADDLPDIARNTVVRRGAAIKSTQTEITEPRSPNSGPRREVLVALVRDAERNLGGGLGYQEIDLGVAHLKHSNIRRRCRPHRQTKGTTCHC